MARIIVYHGSYGCDTGCCGHVIETDDGRDMFCFSHPWGDDPRQYAEELVRDKFGPQHVADLDWDHCLISED